MFKSFVYQQPSHLGELEISFQVISIRLNSILLSVWLGSVIQSLLELAKGEWLNNFVIRGEPGCREESASYWLDSLGNGVSDWPESYEHTSTCKLVKLIMSSVLSQVLLSKSHLVLFEESWVVIHLLEKSLLWKLVVNLQLFSWESELSLLSTIRVVDSFECLRLINVGEDVSVVISNVINILLSKINSLLINCAHTFLQFLLQI